MGAGRLATVLRQGRLCLLVLLALCYGLRGFAQTVQPIIVEYKGKAEGKFQVTNNTLRAMAVTIEPRSFSINPDGMAIYRTLDPAVHVELSAMSVKLLPQQSYLVFYKAKSDVLPAWFTIYATFSPITREPGVNLRFMLPHTVYLYQKEALAKASVDLSQVTYEPADKIVSCDIENKSPALGRAREGSIVAGSESVPLGGFPLLPDSPRHLKVQWTGKKPPEYLVLHFDHFDLKEPITADKPSTSLR